MTLTQISSLVDVILRNENFQTHFNLGEEETYDIISRISDKQYSLFLALLGQKQYRPNRPGGVGLNDLMIQWGFKVK